MVEDAEDPAIKALCAEGGAVLEGGRGVCLHGWCIRTQKDNILGADGIAQYEEDLKASHLPEMVFGGSRLDITHEESGIALSFGAKDALKGWQAEGLPPLHVQLAGEWQNAREQTMPEDLTRVEYDWTFTTGYTGSVATRGGEEAAWEACEGGIDRARLMRRDPILFFDEMVLYESELDDNGISQCSLKVRVMPHCWYVLLRFWLRVDNHLVRLRETRIFCPLRPVAGGGGAAAGVGRQPVYRECTFREGTFADLQKGGAPPPTDGVYSNPDTAGQVLEAVAPVGVKRYWTERLPGEG